MVPPYGRGGVQVHVQIIGILEVDKVRKVSYSLWPGAGATCPGKSNVMLGISPDTVAGVVEDMALFGHRKARPDGVENQPLYLQFVNHDSIPDTS